MKHHNLTLTIAFILNTPLAINAAPAAKDESVEVIEIYSQKDNTQGLSVKDTAVNGPFGDNLAIQDIARSVTPISSELIEQLNITTLQDVLAVSPNTYSASGFGAPSLPTIRGQLGELFQDGIRRQAGNNGFGIPLSFNSVEQIDVVKGAPPVLFGSSQRNGGFVNLHSKKASTYDTKGKLSLSAGRWDQYRALVDFQAPIIKDKIGLRVSAEHVDSGSFYDFSSTQSDSFYAALSILPDNKSSWDINFEYFKVEFTDNAGINRPTQALIDDGLYITGQGVQENGSTIPKAGSIISPTGQVKIDRSKVLTDPANLNNASTYLIHSIYKRELTTHLSLKNTSYFQHLAREEIAQNSFVEIIDGADTAQNRTEITYQWDDTQQTIFAFDIRYNDVLGYSQFTTEADSPIDLTGPISNRRIPLTEEQKARLVELRPGVFVSPGGQYDVNNDGTGDFNLSDTTDSRSWQTGLAIQQDSQWTEKLRTSFGYRVDFYDVTAEDPIAPANQITASDSISDTLHSGQISFNYNLDSDLTLYGAASYNEATSNSMAGGSTLGADNTINPLNFATENTLAEFGLKYVPADSDWYADGALFSQRRSLRNRDGSNTGIRTEGFESQVFYDAYPFWFSAGYSYIDARYDDSGSAQDSAQIADAFDNSRPDIIAGNSIGAPSYTAFAASNRQVQGIPEQSLSLNGNYSINLKWKAGFSGLYTKSYPLDFLGTVKIRDQYTLNINSIYAFTPTTKLRFDINNVTNQKNWRPVFEGGYFGATLVFPELPINAKLTLTHSF
ncbi:TonB-dependent receptor plug domain-containing protein [Psychrosphaera sp. B3R10]|uniref:TonB-dependent receptor n=1 Tax=unclassified Psychrosphaera TaxID=2641570 RepID=UPI001C094C0C|nr:MULTISPECIES: TonB-dependent receptor [unclassified Psychrosphaera]MBU2883204.1 TonB-dependent receptor plug domain-containing protein [Psychrosphaera sp. I2R16]MBU2988660.1 TonB-dependent receptor plug domain-containing protein [Psychrosphaera sp. B3R10]